jgi:hypothetical protein
MLLQEISNWKLDAKLEDSARYFYHKAEVDEILAGRKTYVIRKKGDRKDSHFRKYTIDPISKPLFL